MPITEFYDARRLSLNERLSLLMDVCSAVQHAHQKGIIYRDLKPSNILVAEYDGKRVPKVIDFGLAKALDPFAEGPRVMVECDEDSQTYSFEDFNDSDFNDHVCSAVPLNDFEVEITSVSKSAAFQHDLRGPQGTIISNMTPGDSAVFESFVGKTSFGINNHVKTLKIVEDGSKVLLVEYLKLTANVVRPDDTDDYWECVPQFHPGGLVNVLHVGGHVLTRRASDIDPSILETHDLWWKPNRE